MNDFDELIVELEARKEFELYAERFRKLCAQRADELRKIRLRANLSVKCLAHLLNVEAHTLSKIEAGAEVRLPVSKLTYIIKQYKKLERSTSYVA